MSPASSPDPRPVPSPAIPPAAEPTGHHRSEHEASLSLVAQLRARIQAADGHLIEMQRLADPALADPGRVLVGNRALARAFEQVRERIGLARAALIADAGRENCILSSGSDGDGQN